MDYTDLLKGSVTLEEVASHLSEQDSVAGVEEEIFKLIRAVHDDTLLQGYRRGMADVIGCAVEEVIYWTDEDGKYDGVYRGPAVHESIAFEVSSVWQSSGSSIFFGLIAGVR